MLTPDRIEVLYDDMLEVARRSGISERRARDIIDEVEQAVRSSLVRYIDRRKDK